MADAFDIRVVPATTTLFDKRVRRWPAAVVTIAGSGWLGGEMGMVLVPICRVDDPRKTTMLSTAKPGPPGAWVVPAARM